MLRRQKTRPFAEYDPLRVQPQNDRQPVYRLEVVLRAGESEVNKRGRPSKWPPECLPSKFVDFECAFSLIIPWREYDSQRPLFGGHFLGQLLAADSLPGAFVHSREKTIN